MTNHSSIALAKYIILVVIFDVRVDMRNLCVHTLLIILNIILAYNVDIIYFKRHTVQVHDLACLVYPISLYILFTIYY